MIKYILITLLVLVSFKSAWAADADSDKLDLKKLEDKYWSAKDDDFSVVQNRAFPKAGRYFVNLNYGIPINDPYDTGNAQSLAVGYYFTERLGVEVNYMKTSYHDNNATTDFISTYGIHPDQNNLLGQTVLQLNYVPLYAKMSFLDKSIIYFDMGIGAILGETSYEESQVSGDTTKTGTTYGFSLFQQFFLSTKWAIKADYRNTWTNEERVHYATGASLDTKSVNDSQLLLGVTYYFSFKSPAK